ncbi:methyltransferase domain-containing protein [Brasilonema sp. CT11]|nr:methyltransferase domain-containing protein [Brasilonema sp. CT11]
MKKSLLSILACPRCEGEIELKSGETIKNGEVISGSLQCLNCGLGLPIIEGVPCMLLPEQQQQELEGFTSQWQYRFSGKFEGASSLYGSNPEDRIEHILAKFVCPIQPNEWILDAGCGSAEMTFAMAQKNPQAQIVGLELSKAVRLAARQAGSIANIHFVQGDVMNPPLKKTTFRKIYSMGVLHHTSNTKTAFERVASLLSNYGDMVIWLYPDPLESPANIPYYAVRDVVFMGMGHKIPSELRFWSIRTYSLAILPLIIVARFFWKSFFDFGQKMDWILLKNHSLEEINEATSFWEKLDLLETYQTICFWLFDDITPEFQFRHKKQEVIQWFKENKFDEVHADNIGTYWGKRLVNY